MVEDYILIWFVWIVDFLLLWYLLELKEENNNVVWLNCILGFYEIMLKLVKGNNYSLV